MRRYRVHGGEHLTVVLEDAPDPRPGYGELRVDVRAASLNYSLGGPGIDGVLAEQIVVPAPGVVCLPGSMSFEAASTLPCAGVSAWSTLFERRPIQLGETVLLLGTGGVSIFALQLAKLAGARVILTSSSDAKLERAQTLGADHVINYMAQPDWEEEVLALTGGTGADLAVDVAGPATLSKTLRRLASAGGSRSWAC